MVGAVLGIALVWLIVELVVWFVIAQFISGWWVFLWLIAAFFIGGSLLRNGMQNIGPMAQQMRQGGMMNTGMRPPQSVMIKSLALAAAGILLMIPGVLSDVLALLLLIPAVQNKLHDKANQYMMRNQQKMMDMMQERMRQMNIDPSQFPQGGGGFGSFGGGSFGGGGFSASGGFGTSGGFGKSSQTVDSEARVVNPDKVKDMKTIEHAANDDD